VEGRDETWVPGGYGRLGGPGNPPEKNRPGTQRRGERRADAGVAGNARLTAANATVLLVLLAAEGVTVLRVRQLLSPHVFIGVVLIPPVLLKVASTTWRLIAASLVAGVTLGFLLLSHVGHWLSAAPGAGH
jgi:hypothetical protein